MTDSYWELDHLGDNLARAHLFLVNQRRFSPHGEFYGPSKDPWCQFVLTYNVIESIHSLGFPLDSPRLQRALDWMKATVDSVEMLGEEEAILGKLFLLKSFQYMPGFEKRFKDKLATLTSFIEKNLKNKKAEMLPFMVLDSFIMNDLSYEPIVIKTFEEIKRSLDSHKNAVGKLSYAFYLSCKYIEVGHTAEVLIQVKLSSAEFLLRALEANNDYSNMFHEVCYCLLNIGRIDTAVLKEFGLDDHFNYVREWAIKYLANNTNNISYNINEFSFNNTSTSERKTLPNEISKAKDVYVNIYKLSIILRAISVSSSDSKQLKVAVAHSQLKVIYENFFDPVYKKYKIAKILNVSLFILILMFTCNYILLPYINQIVKVNTDLSHLIDEEQLETIFIWAGGITGIITLYKIFKEKIIKFIHLFKIHKQG